MIKINKPYIEHHKTTSRIVSEISINNENFLLFYEVDRKYSEFLTYERADSFVVALLPYAMKNNKDIVSEAPISNKLLYQVNNYIIPSLTKYRYHTKPMKVRSKVSNVEILKGNAVGTGLSSGVDSFETISNHIDLKNKKYNVTHAVFLNVGSHGRGEKAEKLYLQRLNLAQNVARDLNIELIHVNSNIGEVFDSNYVSIHTFLSTSAILTLQKLFRTYYYASGYPISEFKITKNSGAANFDLLTLSSVSTENLQFFTTGIEKTRLDKVKSISNFEPSYRWLNVCTRTIENCGECDKCIRTQLELYSIDKLDLYHEVFNLNKFRNNYKSYIGYALANIDSSYNKEIIETINKNKRIPFTSYVYSIKHFIKKILTGCYRNLKGKLATS